MFILVERIVRAEREGGMKERCIYSCSGLFIHVLYIVKGDSGEG